MANATEDPAQILSTGGSELPLKPSLNDSNRSAYIWAASACALLALVGFSRTYYLKELFGTPQLPLVLHVLLVFVRLFIAALAYRRRPSMHKRLMLLTTISLLPPAIARAKLLLTANQDAQMCAVDMVIVAVVVIDVVRHRRLHPAIGWGSLAMLTALNLGYEAFQTDRWIRFVTRIFT